MYVVGGYVPPVTVGDLLVGTFEGSKLGKILGSAEGDSLVGSKLGRVEGSAVGVEVVGGYVPPGTVGDRLVGVLLGRVVVGFREGAAEGNRLGLSEGVCEGLALGRSDGDRLGFAEGTCVVGSVGAFEG